MDLKAVRAYLRTYAVEAKVSDFTRFFKTGPGEYAEGDKFLGVPVPGIRRTLKKTKQLNAEDIVTLIQSEWHEERALGLFVLERRFRFAKFEKRQFWVDLYLSKLRYVNNWDLVDGSADKILGEFLYEKGDFSLLRDLAVSNDLWERRIAILSTFAFIKHKVSGPTYEIALILLQDAHDLIQKAVGWMLREAGKRVNEAELLAFLNLNARKMPRTMLRYAVERLDPAIRKKLMTRT